MWDETNHEQEMEASSNADCRTPFAPTSPGADNDCKLCESEKKEY